MAFYFAAGAMFGPALIIVLAVNQVLLWRRVKRLEKSLAGAAGHS